MAELKIVLDGQPVQVKTFAPEAIIVAGGQAQRIRFNPMSAMALAGSPAPINVFTRTPPPLTIRPTVSNINLPLTSLDQGAQGPPGPPGIPGEPGSPGPPGPTWLHGTTNPVGTAPQGALYLNSSSGDLFAYE